MPTFAHALPVTEQQRAALEQIARSGSLPHRQVVQARALLLAADGVGTNEVARRCCTTNDSVRSWRRRFVAQGIEGIGRIAPGRGRKSWLPPGTVEAIVKATLNERPEDGSTHWTTRLLAERLGVGKDTVARVWRDHNLKPWKTETFKISNDRHFEEKLVDVVGLYLNPRRGPSCSASTRRPRCKRSTAHSQAFPMKPGRAGTMTHDYKRNGTVDLFAALNVGTGEVIYGTRKQHTARDVLAFFKLVDLDTPKDLDIHVVLDNLSAHKAPEVMDWLAHPRRARWHLHFTPTSSSWLNLVERWFKELTDRRLRRGAFSSVEALTTAIELWADHWNDDPQPFIWHKTAEEIIKKVRRGRSALTRVTSATDH